MSLAARLARLRQRIESIPETRASLHDLAIKTAKAMDNATLGLPFDASLLPKWWHLPLKPVAAQRGLWLSKTLYNVVPAGRRGGKSLLGKRKIIREAIKPQLYDDAWYVVGAPTHAQVKRIFWKHLKAAIPPILRVGRPNESELTINLWNGARISLMGLDVPERGEGNSIDGLLLDEYGNMKEEVWSEHLYPAIDRGGWAWMIGTPEGRNHYYETYTKARADETGLWGTFTWTSEEVLSPERIAQAKADLDDLTYQQEYLASFVSFQGRAYYPFLAETHADERFDYDPDQDLVLMFDFNVDPGVCAIGQEARDRTLTKVIDEVYIPQNSNTPRVCRVIAERYAERHKKMDVVCYGDSTGGNRGSAKIAGSDWDLIKMELRPVFGERLKFRVPDKNPAERSRVNAMNSRLKTTTGVVRLKVDPKKCPRTVQDFEGVQVLEGTGGELDKDSDPKLTHLTDGIGYYIHRKYPIAGGGVTSNSSY